MNSVSVLREVKMKKNIFLVFVAVFLSTHLAFAESNGVPINLKPVDGKKINLKVLPALNKITLGRVKFLTEESVKFNTEKREILFMLNGKIRGGIVDAKQFDVLHENWSVIYKSIKDNFLSFRNTPNELISSNGTLARSYLDSVRNSLATNGVVLTADQVAAMTRDIIENIRTDWVVMEAIIDYDMMASAQDMQAYMDDMITTMFNSAVASGWAVVGDIGTNLVLFDAESGSYAYQDTKTGEITEVSKMDIDNDGIEDDDEEDGRGDGENSLADAIGDWLYGDDGDGITYESEGGHIVILDALAYSFAVQYRLGIADLATAYASGAITSDRLKARFMEEKGAYINIANNDVGQFFIRVGDSDNGDGSSNGGSFPDGDGFPADGDNQSIMVNYSRIRDMRIVNVRF
jgi:hypothetical protein